MSLPITNLISSPALYSSWQEHLPFFGHWVPNYRNRVSRIFITLLLPRRKEKKAGQLKLLSVSPGLEQMGLDELKVNVGFDRYSTQVIAKRDYKGPLLNKIPIVTRDLNLKPRSQTKHPKSCCPFTI